MSKTVGKFWFKLDLGHPCFLTFLTYADTLDVAIEIFGLLSMSGDVVKLTWAELNELAGCLIPTTSKESDFARGNCIFISNAKRFVLYQDVR